MRVLWLSHFLPYPPKGGALQRSYHLLRAAARRHEIHLVALSQRAILGTLAARSEAEEALRKIATSVTSFEIPADASRLHWAFLVGATALRSAPYDVTWLESRPMARHLQRLSAAKSFDLIHVDTIGLWPYIALFDHTPIALTHHNVESQMMARRAGREAGFARRWYFRREAAKLERLERAACVRAGINFVVSGLDAKRLDQVVPGCAIQVVENGVDAEYFRPEHRSERPRSMVFAGGLNWYPNRDAANYFLTEVWPLLAPSDPMWSVSFVGQSPPDDLLRMASERVDFPGFVDDVRPYLDQAEIYICPMRDGGGTRLKVLDALAMEKPLVATGMAVEGIDVVDGEHYLRADSAPEFARAIERLASDPPLRRRLGRNGRLLVEARYAWPVVALSLEEGYARVLDPATITTPS